MYSYYCITVANDFDSYQFRYKLESHRPAQEWAHIMNQVDHNSLRSGLNPWQGIIKSPVEKINKLNQLIHDLNKWLPENDKIKNQWDNNDPQGSLNKLHVHFPHHEKNESDVSRISQLGEYNDIIHELEDIFRSSAKNEFIWLLLIPERKTEILLNDEDYKYFHPDRFFGELCLHYPHVGRHPLELLKSNDISCPVDQICSQTVITSYHTLRFHDDATNEQYEQKFFHFYQKSTINQKYLFNDPKMAFGYITLGKLVDVNNQVMSKDEILSIVKSTNKILGWEIS